MLETALDHIAIGMARIADATAFLVGRLGGRAESGGAGPGFRWACWRFGGGGRIEVIEPAGADGFLHRFLAARGPGIHHVTFRVSSLADAAARAEARGFRLVGRDESDPRWRVAYLHPKEALGIVVQLAEAAGPARARPWAVPPGPPAAPAAARVLGLRTRARTRAGARRQWEEALSGTLGPGPAGELVFRWPGSPLRIVAEVRPEAAEGPVAIELAGEPSGATAELPAGPVAPLGTVFAVERRWAEPRPPAGL